MALSPSVPTSFVPKQPVAPTKRPRSTGSNIFFIASLFILIMAIVGAAGTFLYSEYLGTVESSKGAQVTAAENSADPATVQQFIQLRNQLSAADMILNQHVALSQFFTLLQSITLQNVSFNSLALQVNPDRSASITLAGTASDFNALAAESQTFGAQQDIQDAIFSNIGVDNTTGTVSFTITATLVPSLVIESAPPQTPALLAPTTASAASNASLDTSSLTATTSP